MCLFTDAVYVSERERSSRAAASAGLMGNSLLVPRYAEMILTKKKQKKTEPIITVGVGAETRRHDWFI